VSAKARQHRAKSRQSDAEAPFSEEKFVSGTSSLVPQPAATLSRPHKIRAQFERFSLLSVYPESPCSPGRQRNLVRGLVDWVRASFPVCRPQIP